MSAIQVSETGYRDLVIIEPRVLGDQRGYFMESYNQRAFHNAGITMTFIQDNQSSSRKGVLRGLHFQRAPYAQTKLIRVLSGEIMDVVVDLRRSEPTFGKHFSVCLSAANKKQLLVPKGFAHGFVVLSESAEVFYKCDEFYNPDADAGIHSMSLGIDWKLPHDTLILSEKDTKLPRFSETSYHF